MVQIRRQPIRREAADGTITVTQVRSSIANKPKTRGTMRALGLRKIGDTSVLPDRPEIRGMLARVPHLVTVVDNGASSGAADSGSNTDSKEG
ncbi:MAG: rpmD [Ilumatobacteraceae bacterium]|nr:rpmD [Ilumatobacteraceae bacterium]